MNDIDVSHKMTRRQFQKYVVIGSAGLAAAAIASPLVGYFLSPTWKQTESLTLPIVRADSIQYIMVQVPFGSLIRSIHFYAASAMVVFVVLHLFRVFFMFQIRGEKNVP